MKNFVGGLFKNRENAQRAHKALLANGLDEKSMNMLECTHEKEAVVLDKNPSIQSIGKSALTGAIALGSIGGLIGLLVGFGVIHIPSLDPNSQQALPFQITWQFILAATAAGVFLGAWTGAILGAAIRLAKPQYHKVETTQAASKGDLMLAVEADGTDRSSKARSIMEKNGAVRFEEFKDNWDPEIWSVFNEEASQVR